MQFAQRSTALILAASMLISCGQQAAQESRTHQIIGKDDRVIQDFEGVPPVLSLTYKGEHICNGGFVESNIFVTAKHCFAFSKGKIEEDLHKYSVSFKNSSFSFESKFLKVAKTIENSDIVYLETENSFFNYYSISEPFSGEEAYIYSIDKKSRNLIAKGEVINDSGLIKYKIDTEKGTSGAPIFQHGKIVGIHAGFCDNSNCGLSLMNPPSVHGITDFERTAVSAAEFAEGFKYNRAAEAIERHIKAHPETRAQLTKAFKEYSQKGSEAFVKGLTDAGFTVVLGAQFAADVNAAIASGGLTAPKAIWSGSVFLVTELWGIVEAAVRPKPEILTPEQILEATNPVNPNCNCFKAQPLPKANSNEHTGPDNNGGGGGSTLADPNPSGGVPRDFPNTMSPELGTSLGEIAADVLRHNPEYHADTALIIAFLSGMESLYSESSLGEEFSEDEITSLAFELLEGNSASSVFESRITSKAKEIRSAKISIILNQW